MRKTLNLSRRLSSMLLTISTTHIPATDLGYILHKNPARLQTEALSFGKAHVFYPEAKCRSLHECVFGVLALESEPIDPTVVDIAAKGAMWGIQVGVYIEAKLR